VNSPYKRKCWTNSVVTLVNSLLWFCTTLTEVSPSEPCINENSFNNFSWNITFSECCLWLLYPCHFHFAAMNNLFRYYASRIHNTFYVSPIRFEKHAERLPTQHGKNIHHTLIKKKRKFSSYIRKFRWGIGCKVIYEEGLPIYEEMHKYLTIYEEAISHTVYRQTS